MFFIMGISNGRKDFDFRQLITCEVCGAYGRFEVYMTYTVLTVFFIPVLKWGKKYYVQTSCCNTLYECDPEVGKRIAAGENVEIRQSDLYRVSNQRYQKFIRRCKNCGFSTEEDFEFCPKCGQRF